MAKIDRIYPGKAIPVNSIEEAVEVQNAINVVLFRTQAYAFDKERNIWSEAMDTIEVLQNTETKEIKVVVI